METKWIKIILTVASVAVFLLLFALNFFYFNMNNSITAAAVLSLVFPYFIYKNILATRARKIDEQFTNFLLDLGSIMETRVSLMQAMPSIYKRDYGILSKYIRRLHIESSWGIPFFDAFIKMGRATKSKMVNKSISAVMGTFLSGGDLKRIFSAIGLHAREIRKIKESIRGRVKIITITCYLIFSCLLFSVYIIATTFLPSIAEMMDVATFSVEDFKTLIFHLMLIQSLFAGLIAGQMAEGSIFSGVKHSIILVIITIAFYSILL